jgi:arylformamidase
MSSMRLEDYPPQEPFTEIGQRYHAEVTRLGVGIEGVETVWGQDPYQSFTIYPAANPRGDVLCLMHGGGWTSGYKEWMAFMAPALTARGITAISMGYRLAPMHVFPACFEDVAMALTKARALVANHGGDPNRMFVGGHSAGGHLAALLALRTDWRAATGAPPDAVRGALPISGTYLFGPESGLSMRPRFLGDPSLGNEAPASPMTHVHPDAPPFLIAHGQKDFPHLVKQSEAFAAALRSSGVRVEVLELEDQDHLGASYASGDPDGAWVAAADAFMAAT